MDKLKLGDRVTFSQEVVKKNYSYVHNGRCSVIAEQYQKGELSEEYDRYTTIKHKESLTGIVCGVRTVKFKGYSSYQIDEGYIFIPLEHKRVYLVATSMNSFHKVLVEDIEPTNEGLV
jgi:hypothetical protein